MRGYAGRIAVALRHHWRHRCVDESRRPFTLGAGELQDAGPIRQCRCPLLAGRVRRVDSRIERVQPLIVVYDVPREGAARRCRSARSPPASRLPCGVVADEELHLAFRFEGGRHERRLAVRDAVPDQQAVREGARSRQRHAAPAAVLIVRHPRGRMSGVAAVVADGANAAAFALVARRAVRRVRQGIVAAVGAACARRRRIGAHQGRRHLAAAVVIWARQRTITARVHWASGARRRER